MGFFNKLKQGLLNSKIIFKTNKVDEELLEELEEKLIMADVGFETSEMIIEEIRKRIKKEKIQEVQEIKEILKQEINKIFENNNSKLNLEKAPSVILMVGVNGAGKTTSIGKIAKKLKDEGKSIMIVAGDTFRAGAVEQLEVWAKRAEVEIVIGKENQDPSSVIFDSIVKAKQKNIDVLICDTAGRLQNKKHLMDELAKMKRIIDRELPDSSKETLLVLDGSVGQNAISQVKAFSECTGLTGLIITKLDGTYKGGIIINLVKQNNLSIKFIGVGEQIEDMQEFNSEQYIEAMFEE